jgi:nitroreductase
MQRTNLAQSQLGLILDKWESNLYRSTMPLRIKTTLKKILLVLRIFKKSVPMLFAEYVYFNKAKLAALDKEKYRSDLKGILLRKRTHHLERVLWQPSRYPKAYGEETGADLETLTQIDLSGVTDKIQGWSKKILREYKKAQEGQATYCPVLQGGVERSSTKVSTPEFVELIKSRRSRRVFENIPLTHEEKVGITEVSQYAPSSCNRQTVELIFVEDQKLKELVAQSIPGGYQFFSLAPAIVIVLSDGRDYKFPEDRVAPFVDAAAAIQNIYLYCETTQLGCCWGSLTSYGSIIDESGLRKRLNIPDTHLIVASLAIGKSTQHVCHIPRDKPENRFGVNGFRMHVPH